jgi:CheY-like chemotaxis protein
MVAAALAFVQGTGPAPDLVILDLNLPKNDGIQVLQAIQESKRFAYVPIVITSFAPSLPPTPERLHFAKYIAKPADLEEFLRIGVVLKDVIFQSKAGD